MVNEQGYYRPTYDELLAGRIAQAQELFGEDIDTSNASPLGKFIRLSVQDLADAYEAQEIIYYSRFPHTATGQNLDRLMPFAGITRNPATRAEHTIKFTGTANHVVPVGFLVGTTGDKEFFLVNEVTLNDSGVGSGTVQCTELGTIGNVKLGSITEIVNPDVDVSAIEHTGIVTVAEDEESDADLRARFDIAIEGSGSGTASAIRGAVMRINGVRSCLIVENKNATADADGRPPNSFEVYVYAPPTLNQQIGEAIFSKKPLGIQSHGTTSVTVEDVSGHEQTVYFSHVSEVTVSIKVAVKKDTHFELNGVEQIKNALLEYVNSLKNGEDVIYANLYKYIFQVSGVKDVTSLTLSTNGTTFTAANISISSDKVASLSANNITVEVSAYADS